MKTASKVLVYVNGEKLEMENGAKFSPGGDNATFDRHGGRTYSHSTEVAPRVSGNVLCTKDFDIIALSSIEDATVMITDDVGHKFLMTNARTENVLELDASSGRAALSLVGDQFERL